MTMSTYNVEARYVRGPHKGKKKVFKVKASGPAQAREQVERSIADESIKTRRVA